MLTQIAASSGRRNRLSPCDLGARTKGTAQQRGRGRQGCSARGGISRAWALGPLTLCPGRFAREAGVQTLSKTDPTEGPE